MAFYFVVIFVLLCCTSGNHVQAQSVLPRHMRIRLHMVGEVNGHEFQVEGEGEGRPYKGTQTIRLQVTEGGPLPFAFDILTTAFQYGNRAFTNYPPEIPDYFKESFPEGHTWERTMVFQDGGICVVSNDIRMIGDCFEYRTTFNCDGFDPNGPIMMKETLGWEPSCEAMYAVDDGALQGDDYRYLMLEGGGHFRCDFKSTYRARRRVQMPDYHFINHRIKITSHDEEYLEVTVVEYAMANHSPLPEIPAK